MSQKQMAQQVRMNILNEHLRRKRAFEQYEANKKTKKQENEVENQRAHQTWLRVFRPGNRSTESELEENEEDLKSYRANLRIAKENVRKLEASSAFRKGLESAEKAWRREQKAVRFYEKLLKRAEKRESRLGSGTF
jgi:rubrerythrin